MLVATGVLFLVHAACRREILSTPPTSGPPTLGPTDTELATTRKPIEKQIEAFCGACHTTPLPVHFARQDWLEEVQQGYRLYFQSERTNLHVPVMSEVVAYYEQHAPDQLPLPPSQNQIDSGGLSFRQSRAPDRPEEPAIAHLLWDAIAADGKQVLLSADMRSGEVRADQLGTEMTESVVLAKLQHPDHVVVCDLDGDGGRDLVVADLGTFEPADHDKGRVVALRRDQGGNGAFQLNVLAAGLGRVADVQAADLDSDRDLDLVVAEFGWRQTGRVLWLESQRPNGQNLAFQQHVVDARHGAIHAPITDMNQDGKPDFVALLAQEFESVEMFLNEGTGQFRSQRLFTGDRPSFGSTGITLADLDQDGDQDILYTNGDMMDDFELRDYHAVHWLENQGQIPWKDHVLGVFPGVNRALAADLDRDGDQDVVACALIPDRALAKHSGLSLASLIWYEQRAPGEFVPHVLEINQCHHAAMEIGDFDANGNIDLIVGNFVVATGLTKSPYTIWWNAGRGAARPQESKP